MLENRKSDRRKTKIDFNRRKWDRREGVFYYTRTAYLTDTNLFQNVYFAQYFQFMGEAREAFLNFILGDKLPSLVASGIAISTVETDIRYHQELTLYDVIRINVRIVKISKIKVHMQFDFIRMDNSSKVASGNMVVCFKNKGKPIPVPEFILDILKSRNLYKAQ